MSRPKITLKPVDINLTTAVVTTNKRMINIIGNIIGTITAETAAALASIFATRVEEDGGIVESQDCLTDRIQNLKTLGLWDKASAVWMPHGYKEGKLYAVKGGSAADLTITRAGTRTRKGPTYVEQVPYNLLGYSNSLNNAYWGKTNITVTENDTLSPSGNVNANKITETTATAAHTIGRSLTGGPGTYTIEFFAKAGTRKYLGSQFYNLTYTGEINFGFDIEAGTMLTPATAGTGVSGSSAISQAENGFFKITLTINVTNTATTGFVSTWYLRNASGTGALSYLGDTGSYLYLYGINIVSGSALDYFQTTDRFNVPALDYTNDTCPALSLEPARTNIALRSEEFDNATWSKVGLVVAANNIAGPDNLSTADKLTANTGTTQVVGQSTTTLASTSYTISFYVKAGNHNYVWVRFTSNATSEHFRTQVFDLSDGTVGENKFGTTGGSGTDVSIKDFGDGWWRVSIVANIGTVTDGNLGIGLANAKTGNTFNNFGAISGTFAGTEYIYATGAQLEAGSYATSYIPTTAGTVMRIADSVNALTGVSSLIGQTEGTLYADFIANSESGMILTVSGSATDRILIYVPAAAGGDITGYIQTGGVLQANIQMAAELGVRYKAALVYGPGGASFFVNGVKIGADVTVTLASGYSTINVGANVGGGSNFYGEIYSAKILKTALTDAEAIALTTP